MAAEQHKVQREKEDILLQMREMETVGRTCCNFVISLTDGIC
jgi:hypothetical protein